MAHAIDGTFFMYKITSWSTSQCVWIDSLLLASRCYHGIEPYFQP